MKKMYFIFALLIVSQLFAQGPGKALDFDGSDDYASIAGSGTVLGSYTVEAWIQPKHATKTMHIFCSRSFGDYTFDIQLRSGNQIHANIGTGNEWLSTAANATYNYTLGVWFHLAYVVTPSGYTIYVNGQQLATSNFATSGTPLLMNPTKRLELGRYTGASTFFRGSLDDVKVYNTALTQAQVQADMNSETPSVPANCLINYTFTNGTANGPNPGLSTVTNMVDAGNYRATLIMFWMQSPIGNWTTDRFSSNVRINNSYYVATLKDAFDWINSGQYLSGAITITIMGNTNETAKAILYPSGTGASSYTSVTIKPLGARTISGNINRLIDLEGADNVTIDGLNSGGNSLTISNTSTGIVSTIYLWFGANNTTITNCTILGSCSSAEHDAGTIYIQGTNNNVTVSNNNIGSAGANMASAAIRSTTSAIANATGLNISNNNIYDYSSHENLSSGIDIQSYIGAVIQNNRLYQTAPRNVFEHYGISVISGSTDLISISGNTIGYANQNGTGNYEVNFDNNGRDFIGIKVYSSSSNTTPIVVSNNIFSGITVTGGNNMPSMFNITAIKVNNGVATISNNTIGSMTVTGSISYSSPSRGKIYGISLNSILECTVKDNLIGGITNNAVQNGEIYGIISDTYGNYGSLWTCENNIIGGSIANSIQNTTPNGENKIIGIETSTRSSNITGNTIRNLTNATSAELNVSRNFSGINAITNLTGSTVNVSKNTIYNLRHINGGAMNMFGIYSASHYTATINIDGNSIYGISSSGNTFNIYGIQEESIFGTTNITNNMVALNNGTNGSMYVYGIMLRGNSATTANLYHNSIHIGGSPNSGYGSNYALYSFSPTQTRNIRNNILANTSFRDASANRDNYMISILGFTNLTMDSNLFWTENNTYFGLNNNSLVTNLTNWRNSTTKDPNSYFANPNFTDTSATSPNLHISPTIGSLAEGKGFAIPTVTTDFDGQTRSGLTPVDIGADAGDFIVAPHITSLSTTSGCPESSLTINGSDLGTVTSVSINAIPATITSSTPTAITVAVSNGASGTGPVSIIASNGIATSMQNFTLLPRPVITSQPATPTTTCPLNSVTNIAATVTGATSYQWRKNGINLTNTAPYSNVTTATLRITNPGYEENESVLDLVTTNSSGCSTITNSVVFSVAQPLTIAISPASPTICIGSGTELTASGATTYTWSPAIGLSATTGAVVTANPSVTTVYTVTGSDSYGCTKTAMVTVTVTNPSVSVSATSTLICPGSVSVLTATGADTYTWSPATGLNATTGNSVTASPAATTVYTVTGTDAGGCSVSKMITVFVKLPVVLTSASICAGQSATLGITNRVLRFDGVNDYMNIPKTVADDFTIEFWMKTTQTGGTGVNWYNGHGIIDGEVGGNVNDFGIALVGSKLAFGIGGNGAAETTLQSVSSVNNGQWAHVAVTRKKTTGFIEIYINGIKEASVVTSNKNTLTNPANLRVGSLLNGSNYFNGSIDDIRIWNVVRNQSEISTNLETDFSSNTSGLLQNYKMNHKLGTVALNSVDGSTATLTNGPTWTLVDPISSYIWSNGATTEEITVTTSGNYSLQVTDTNGCIKASTSVEVTVNSLPTVAILPENPLICIGSSVSLTASGGVSYTWSPATDLSATTGATVTATPTVTRTYTVIATDSNGCQNTQTVTVMVNNPTLNITAVSPILCSGASTVITASGADSYSWSPATGLSGTTGNSVMASPSETTTYTITATDGNGCVAINSITIVVKDAPVVTASGPLTFCPGESVSLSATRTMKGLSFNGNQSFTVNRNIGDDFTIEFWIKSTQMTMDHPSWIYGGSLVNAFTNSSNIFGISILAGRIAFDVGHTTLKSATSVNTGQWIHVAVTRVRTTGVLSIYINGNLNASATVSNRNTLNSSSTLSVGTLNESNSYYFNGAMDDIRIWNKVRTQADIKSTMTATMISGTPNLVDYFKLDEPTGTIASNTVNPSNDATLVNTPEWTTSSRNYAGYLWSNGAAIATPQITASGTFTAQLTDFDGCVVTSSPITTTVRTTSPIEITAPNTSICLGENTTLTASGGSSFTWSPATGLSSTTGNVVTASPTDTQTYTATTTDSDGCILTKSVTIIVNKPTINITLSQPAICPGGSTELTASGGVSYSWSPATGLSSTTGETVTASPETTTTYTVTVTDANGCSATKTITVNVNSVSMNLTTDTTRPCESGYVNVIASGADNYTWEPLENLYTYEGYAEAYITTTTTFTVTGTNSTGCTETKSITFEVVNMNLGVSASSNGICTGEQTTLTASGAESYVWSPATGLSATTGNEVIASPSVTTTYEVMGTTGDCTSVQYITITVGDLTNLEINASETAICEGISTSLTASGADSYSWSPATGLNTTTGESVVATPLITTTYTVTGTTNGCSKTEQITIVVNNIDLAVTASETIIQPASSTTLTATGGTSYSWSPPTGLSSTTGASVIATPETTTTYTVSSTYPSGCIGEKSITISVGNETALNFDGYDDFVTTTPKNQTITGNFTVEAWVKPMHPTRWMHVFSTRAGGDATFDLQIGQGNIIHCDIGDGNNWITTSADATYNYSINTWMHIAVVVTPTSFTTYVNGCEVGSGSYNSNPMLIDNNHYITIGYNPSEATFFEGTMDDIKVYNTALTQSQILADMTALNPVLPTNVVAHYDFNSGVANANNPGVWILEDKSSSHLYDGGLVNFALNGTSSNWVEGRAIDNSNCNQTYNETIIAQTETSATISWTNTSCGSTNDVHLTTVGGGLPTGTPSHANVTTPLTFNNLQTGSHEFYIRSNCGNNNYSEWRGPFLITISAMADLTTIASDATILAIQNQTYTLKGHVSEAGLTDIIPNISGETPGIEFWIGTSTADTDPASWSSDAWELASWNPAVTDTYEEYQLQKTITGSAVLYYASRARIGGSNASFTYGGTNNGNGGNWDGTTFKNGSIIPCTGSINVTSNTGSFTICNGGSVALSAIGGTSYSWSPPTGLNTTTGANVTASPATTTTYTVSGFFANGCAFSDQVTVSVSAEIPDVTISASGPLAFCEPGSVTLSIDNLIDINSSALHLNGRSFANIPLNAPDDFTIEYWMRTTQVTGYADDWHGGAGIVDGEVPGNVNDLGTSLVNNKLAFGIGGGGSQADKSIFSTSDVNTGNWIHIAATRKRETGEIQLYINGVLESSTITTNQNSMDGLNSLAIGRLYRGDSNFIGDIDQLRIWNTVRTQGQITASMFTETPDTTSGLVDNYLFNEANGTMIQNTVNGILQAVSEPVVWISRQQSSEFASYIWSNGATTPEITVTNSGTFSVQLTNYAGCSKTSESVTTVTSSGSVAISASGTEVCYPGETLQLSASEGAQSYSWSPATGLSSTTGRIVSVTTGSTITYTVTAIFANGCTVSDTETITVHNFTPVIIGSSPSFSACPGESIVLSAISPYNSPAVSFSNNFFLSTKETITVDDFSIEYWMKTTQTGTTGTSWYNGPGIVSTGRNTTDFGTSLLGNKLAFGIGGPSATSTITSTSAINSGIWTHVAVTRSKSSGQLKIYINGVLEASAIVSNTNSLTTSQGWYMGFINGGFSGAFEGSLDDVRIWNTVRSDSEIRNNMNTTFPDATNGMLHYYKFDETIVNSGNPVYSLYLQFPAWVTRDTTFYPSYLWSNGATTPTVTASESGVYTVQVTDFNGCTAESDEVSVNIMPIPTVSGSQVLCYNTFSEQDLTVSNFTGSIVKWQRAFNAAFSGAIDINTTSATILKSTIPVITSPYYFRALINSGSCVYYSPTISVISGGTSTWNGSTWINGIPTSATAVYINGNYSSTGNLDACSLTVQANRIVTVNSGHDFNISGTVTVAPTATLTFENNANLFQSVETITNNNSGNITSKRNIMMRRLDYVYWGSPVANQNLKLFSELTVSPPVGASRFYKYLESTNSFAAVDPLTEQWIHAKGFMIRAPNTWPTDASLKLFEGKFIGVPNNGNYSIGITNASGALGYNLIGNPYPSPVDADLFLAQNPGTLYFWTHANQIASGSNYATYNSLGQTTSAGGFTPTNVIQTGQGFLLKTASNGNANFTNTMRLDDNNGVAFRNSIEKHRIWLNLSNAQNPLLNQMLLGYMTGATLGIDESIDGKLNYSGSSISSLISNENYVAQGRPIPFADSDEVPLHFKADFDGTYTLSIDHVDGLFSQNQSIFLKDNLTGIIHNIKENAYSFATVAGSFSDRFAIVYQNVLGVENPTIDANSIILYKQNGILHINSGTATMKNVKLFDIRGRLIYERNNINSATTALHDLRAEQQVLLVQITSDENKTVTKKVVY